MTLSKKPVTPPIKSIGLCRTKANKRIIDSTAKHLGLSMDKVILTVQDHGNTSAASIPLALDVGIKNGQIKRGQNLLLEASAAVLPGVRFW